MNATPARKPRVILVAANEADARRHRDGNPQQHIVVWATPRQHDRVRRVAADTVAYTPAGAAAGTPEQHERLDFEIRRTLANTRKAERS